MNTTHALHSRFRVWVYVRTFFSLPWCCILTLSAAFLTATGSVVGLWVDEVFHTVLPFLVLLHAGSIYYYARTRTHRTRGELWFLWITTGIFILSVAFHWTPWHDQVLGTHH